MKKTLITSIILTLLLVGIVSANPLWNTLPAVSATVGKEVQVTLTNTAPDNGTSTYSTTAGTLTKINDTQSTFKFTPSAAGTTTANLTVADSNTSDVKPLTITAVAASTNFTVTNLQLGSETQKRNETLTGTLTVTNTGTENLTAFSLSTTTAIGSFKTTDYNITATNVPTTLNAGASATINIEAKIPFSHPAIDSTTFEKKALHVGTLTFSGTAGSTTITQPSTISIQARNKLKIDKVRLTIGGTSKSLNDGDDFKKIKPLDQFEVTVTMENDYSDNENVDMPDVEVRIFTDDNDFSYDENEKDDVDSNDKTEFTGFDSDEIDIDADDNIKLTVTAFGTADHGTGIVGGLHGDKAEITLKIDREKNEFIIRSPVLFPGTAQCGDVIELSGEIVNIGSKDHDDDDVEIEASFSEGNYLERITGLNLDSGDSENFDFPSIRIPTSLAAGTYDVFIKTFYDKTSRSNAEKLQLTVNECSKTSTVPSITPESTAGTVVVTSGTTTTPTGATTATTSPTATARPAVTSTLGTNTGVIIALVVAIVVVLGLIGTLLVFTLRRR
jgi:hypothetical protein